MLEFNLIIGNGCENSNGKGYQRVYSGLLLNLLTGLTVLKQYINTNISSYNPSYVKVKMYPPTKQKKIEMHSKISQLHYFSVILKYKEFVS